ncbi:MAG: mechanosensitive ion channel family protein [Clostridium sp.]|nr:mechanosensitive ion channel family protein [Clostridium sp.]MCM1547434.1 mechanosensitive ion channel family protein [Ruminococcus sp.]
MTYILTQITALPTNAAESETDAANAVEAMIADAVNTTAEKTSRLSRMLSDIGDKIREGLPSVIFALAIFIIGIIISRFILRIFTKCIRRTNVDNAAVSFLRSLLKVLLYTIDFIITLSILNIPMTSIIAVISAAGLAVGLALQNSLANLAGGFIILFSKPFKSGDFVETNSASGKVESIGILYTKILTDDNKTIYIPNGKISDSMIINYSEQTTRRVDLEFGISYTDDAENAKKLILELAKNHPLVLHEPTPFARIGKQAEDSIQITVRLWTQTENYWQVKFDFTELVNQSFIDNGITIPFRQLDVHIK